jgi:hypothetical protein
MTKFSNAPTSPPAGFTQIVDELAQIGAQRRLLDGREAELLASLRGEPKIDPPPPKWSI